MNFEDVTKLANAAKAKSSLLNNHFGKYFIRAIIAGFFVDLAMIFCNVTNNVFKGTFPEWGRLIGAMTFAIAVQLIILVGGELFTGNNLVMAFGGFNKTVSWKEVGKVWLISYIGNFVGCFILSSIFVFAGAGGTGDYYRAFIPGKTTIPVDQMFFRAVLCNFLVCLGVLCGIKLQNEIAKIFMILVCITEFVFCGFEHSIANMGNFCAAFYLCPDVSKLGMLKNIVVVSLGNMVGGAILLALPLWAMSITKQQD